MVIFLTLPSPCLCIPCMYISSFSLEHRHLKKKIPLCYFSNGTALVQLQEGSEIRKLELHEQRENHPECCISGPQSQGLGFPVPQLA